MIFCKEVKLRVPDKTTQSELFKSYLQNNIVLQIVLFTYLASSVNARKWVNTANVKTYRL